MAIYNPLYNEETGWTPLDQLAPWQQALMNPGANNPGMSMPTFDQNNPYYQFTQYGPNQTGALPAGYDPYAISNGIAGVYNGSNLTGSNQGGGTGTNAGQMVDPAVTFNNANRTTSPPPGNTTTHTTAPTPTIASPSLLATNMSMTGAENVGGMGMYTGSNGPLDTTRFTPVQGQQQNGPPPGSIPTGDPNTWITPWGATYTTPGSINNSSSAAYDAYRQRAFGDMMGPMGRGPNTNPYAELSDVLRQVPGSINAQTFQGYLGSLQGQQTGPYPPQQTAPRPQGTAQPLPGSDMQSAYQSLLQQGYSPQQAQQFIQQLGMPSAPGSQVAQPGFSQRPGQPGQSPVIGSPGIMGPRPYSNQGNSGYDPVRQRLDMMNMEWAQNPNWYPGATGWNGIPISQYQPIGYRAGYDPNSTPSGGYGPEFQTPTQSSISMGPGAAAFAPGGIYGGQGQMQVDPAMPFGNQRGNLSPDAAAYYYAAQQQQGGQQPNYQQMAAQFSSDPASQAAFIRDFTGYPINYPAGGQQSSNPQNVDFRAATFGGSLFPAPAGGSGSGSSNIPNTTNPSTSQYSTPQAGFGGATNRRGGFGGMSLFGNQFGSGGSTGFGGVPSSQYRGAGSYGRPASYGQSQRPY